MDLLRIGVVGCGAIGREHINRITNKLSGGKVVAVSDLYVEGAHKVGDPIGATVYSNSADLVHDPDVDAIVCTGLCPPGNPAAGIGGRKTNFL